MNPIRVLFLCTGNSARSIMAEALLRQIGGSAFDVYSAGTQPGKVNPLTLQALSKANVDIASLHSKGLSEFESQSFDYVITVCDNAAERCPVFPGARKRLHWGIADPASLEGSEQVRLLAFEEAMKCIRERLLLFIPIARAMEA